MSSCLAFFPWVHIAEPLTVGPIRLVPYVRKEQPGDSPHVTQRDIDAVLAAYAIRHDTEVARATLFELADLPMGTDASRHIGELFRCRELIAFAALAQRRLFQQGEQYSNFDTYTLVVQRFNAGDAGVFSFDTRRRDGGSQYLWDAESFRFTKPNHVPLDARMKLDEDLLAALLEFVDRKSPMFNAICDFNLGNTDSLLIPEHVEVVLMKAAFEFLLGIGHDVAQFRQALRERIPVRADTAVWQGAMTSEWRKKYPKVTGLLEAWAQEFCLVRNQSAHGSTRDGERFVWSERAHLAFSVKLFALLVDAELQRSGKLVGREKKALELAMVESYLTENPFGAQAYGVERRHVWSEIYWKQVAEPVSREDLKRVLKQVVASWQTAEGERTAGC
jgi:hypothetical protein